MAAFKRFMGSKPIIALVTALAAACLAVVFVAAGLAVCSFQPTSRVLANATSAVGLSPFPKDDLVSAAVATRDYTVDTHDIDALTAEIVRINENLLADGKSHPGAPSATALANAVTSQQRLELFDRTDERYVLDSTAISHLDDVYVVITIAWRIIAAIAVVGVLAVAHLVFYRGKRGAGRALLGAGIGLVAVFALIGAYAAIDFNGFFSFFHSLFFAEGSWLFSYDSLLICMLPEEFWIGMGVIWFVVTVALSVISVIAGSKLLKA